MATIVREFSVKSGQGGSKDKKTLLYSDNAGSLAADADVLTITNGVIELKRGDGSTDHIDIGALSTAIHTVALTGNNLTLNRGDGTVATVAMTDYSTHSSAISTDADALLMIGNNLTLKRGDGTVDEVPIVDGSAVAVAMSIALGG